MNAIRQPFRTYLRTYASRTPFVPPASLREFEGEPRRTKRDLKVKPSSPSFYTGRASYYDQLIQLETAISHSRHALTSLQLLPLPEFARQKLLPRQPVWKQKEEMSPVFNSRLTTSRYRRVTTLLSQLNDFQRIASTAGCYELGNGIAEILQLFERENKDAVLARGKRKPVQFDEYGRTYTLGKRKTSAARVWMIPVQKTDPPAVEKPPTDAEQASVLLGLDPEPTAGPEHIVAVSATTILVNNLPLAKYFAIPADRERILRPLKLAGLLGAYNVFALVRGGGTSGQSGAIAHGIAKGLAAHEPEVEAVLRKGKSNILSSVFGD
jgi:small subunit ribosomal protein S9